MLLAPPPPPTRALLDPVPRLGWVDVPTPVTEARFGARAVWIKRDDLSAPLHGSSKTRKLDTLLAQPPLRGAARWASVGAIGSGHLAALVAAGAALDVAVDAYVFWEPVSRGVRDNLAFVAGGAARLHYAGSRTALAIHHPRVLVAASISGAAVIPPGGTNALGTLGLARAGLELGEQVAAGVLPAPRRVYVALGSGGTAAGLAVGLGLAGLDTEVHAVAVVERVFSPSVRLRALVRDALQCLRAHGVALQPAFRPAPIRIRRGFVGRAYGVPSAASARAADALRAAGVPGEEVYTGKAFACWQADAVTFDGPSVFWFTARADAPCGDPAAPPAPAGRASCPGPWEERLPAALRDRLATDPTGAHALRRRQLLQLGAAGAVVVATGARFVGYDLPSWQGVVLSEREAQVLIAAAAALLPAHPGDPPPVGTWDDVAAHTDAFLVGMPRAALWQIRALFVAAEQLTAIGGDARRLTRLDAASARSVLEAMAERGGVAAQVYLGLRDLALVGYWQQPAAWPAIGYGGPLVPPLGPLTGMGRDRRPRPPSRYDHLLAPPGPPPDEPRVPA